MEILFFYSIKLCKELSKKVFQVLIFFYFSHCKEISWKSEWFIHAQKFEMGFWKRKENQKYFLEELASKLGVKEPQDWGKVTTQKIIENNGSSLLHIHKSLRRALEENFPGL